MLKIRCFLNEPNGKPWRRFQKMLPRLGSAYPLEIEYFSQPQSAYMTDEWFERDLPAAPAIMVGEEVVVEGGDISEELMEAAIRKALGLPDAPKKGILAKLFRA